MREKFKAMDLSYLTNNFIRSDCGIHGARLSNIDCEVIRRYVQQLEARGEFDRVGVYWIANHLAAEGLIQPQFHTEDNDP